MRRSGNTSSCAGTADAGSRAAAWLPPSMRAWAAPMAQTGLRRSARPLMIRTVARRGSCRVHRSVARLTESNPVERGQSLGDTLVHVVVAIGAQASHEVDVGRFVRELLVLQVQLGVLRTRNRIV